MSEETKAKIDQLTARLVEVYRQGVAEIQRESATSEQRQAAEKTLDDAIHRKLFGHTHDEQGEEVP